ncbi:Tubulin beta-7 chain [Dendrobium catenatum]|uniref:Tubulin beta-7 chain n=1 Tax=Dendrobium catenatum TaxID=906689 RepID=A0A2I0WZX5_9ASPA|nr:Tubulin beta-7 chain [Dendrobium catenatum]
MFHRVIKKFTMMFCRKAFPLWFTGEGLEKMEFPEAEMKVQGIKKVIHIFLRACKGVEMNSLFRGRVSLSSLERKTIERMMMRKRKFLILLGWESSYLA